MKKAEVYAFQLAHLARFFRRIIVTRVDTPAAVAYALQREEQGARSRIINDELRILADVLSLAAQNGKLQDVPTIPFVLSDSPPPQYSPPLRYSGLSFMRAPAPDAATKRQGPVRQESHRRPAAERMS